MVRIEHAIHIVSVASKFRANPWFFRLYARFHRDPVNAYRGTQRSRMAFGRGDVFESSRENSSQSNSPTLADSADTLPLLSTALTRYVKLTEGVNNTLLSG